MTESIPARELILQMLRTRMSFRQAIQRALKEADIDMTFEMLQIMHRLWLKQGVSQQYLAEQTAKDKACMTNLITNLEKKGWVIRREDQEDKRSRLVFLTERGEEMMFTINPVIKDVYDKVEQSISSKQLQTCLNILYKIDDTLNKI